MDDGAFASSANSSPKRSDGIFHSQNDLLHSEESVEKTESSKDKLAIGEPPVILEQAEESDLQNSVSNIKSFESVHTSQDGVMPRDVSEEARPYSCVNHFLDNDHGGQLKDENARSGNLFEPGFTSQLGCMKTAQDSGSHENSASITAAIGEKMQYHSTKVGQHQHGISRHLQFEDAHSKMTDIPSGSAGYPRSLASRANPEVLESDSLYKPVSPNNMLLASTNQAMFSPQNSENFNIQVPKRSGIGLHLNSIVAVENNAGMKISIKSAQSGNFDGIGTKSAPIMSSHLSENCSLSSRVVEGASLRNLCHARALTGASSVRSPRSMKSFYKPVHLTPVQLQSNLSNKRTRDTENFDSFRVFSLSSPKKKRKKSTDAGDSNGCKRCNCKKTQCLKLYCACFAAGIYCEDPCSCQGCFNRPEYEDTVLGTRQQIESRNPTAFSAKTVPVNEPLANVCTEDGNITPSSSRHKRGCNCKKSKCLKKYCECYQANVGCFDGCRCEGCDNVYGRKGDYGTNKDLVSKHRTNEKLDSSYEMMLKMVPSKDHLQHELYSPHNLTPVTPPFQNSNRNAMGASRTWTSSGRYLQSLESDLNLISPCQLPPGQAKIPEHRNMDLVPFHQDLDFGHGHIANQFSPRCDGPSNVGHFSASGLPNPLDWANASRVQITSGNCHVSSSGSLLWRSSTMTQSTHFGETKLSEVRDFDDGLYRLMGDDTPEILKANLMPPNSVKVSSPSKKRVSPPHVQQVEADSCSSAGLKRCIKVTLKSVPEFPPRTPCIESRDDPGQNVDNSQSSSGSK